MFGIALLIRKPKKGVKTMNTVSVSTTQLVGAVIGLLVTVAAIIVNVKIFGSDLSLINVASYIMLGVLVVLTMAMLVRD
ncbi:hypothetical protein Mtc_0020 [Methanocella conradii HZ254]|uniref:Uncharacterized protein n=2 Tax=Methanocella TaxID=570266 RepID=H8I5A1_METCZ|nr:hypothetical protein Mtc_0020 [Methanocella conradii HZ254]